MDSHPVSIISQCGLHPGRDLIILGPRDKSDFLPTLLASASAGAGSPALLEGEPPPWVRWCASEADIEIPVLIDSFHLAVVALVQPVLDSQNVFNMPALTLS